MSYAAADAEIRNRLIAIWAGATPIAWPNVSFEPPNPASPWIRFAVIDGDARILELGANKIKTAHRMPGLIVIQLFDALQAGDGPIRTLADTAAAIFRNWGGATVQCFAATVKTIGDDGKGWYQVNVSIPFTRDELL